MPRPWRSIDLEYHVINRGNNRQTVFDGEGDCVAFLKALADLKERNPFELYRYCLATMSIAKAGTGPTAAGLSGIGPRTLQEQRLPGLPWFPNPLE
jgi:hypothetical protein